MGLVTSTAVSLLNTQLSDASLTNVFVGFTTLHDSLGQASDGAQQLAGGAEQLSAGTTQLAAGTVRADTADDATLSAERNCVCRHVRGTTERAPLLCDFNNRDGSFRGDT